MTTTHHLLERRHVGGDILEILMPHGKQLEHAVDQHVLRLLDIERDEIVEQRRATLLVGEHDGLVLV